MPKPLKAKPKLIELQRGDLPGGHDFGAVVAAVISTIVATVVATFIATVVAGSIQLRRFIRMHGRVLLRHQ